MGKLSHTGDGEAAERLAPAGSSYLSQEWKARSEVVLPEPKRQGCVMVLFPWPLPEMPCEADRETAGERLWVSPSCPPVSPPVPPIG